MNGSDATCPVTFCQCLLMHLLVEFGHENDVVWMVEVEVETRRRCVAFVELAVASDPSVRIKGGVQGAIKDSDAVVRTGYGHLWDQMSPRSMASPVARREECPAHVEEPCCGSINLPNGCDSIARDIWRQGSVSTNKYLRRRGLKYAGGVLQP